MLDEVVALGGSEGESVSWEGIGVEEWRGIGKEGVKFDGWEGVNGW